MSKLIEQLDAELNAGNAHEFTDLLSLSYPKLRAVVEAAKEVAAIRYGLNGNYLIDELRVALAALEEEV
jgi:glycyl-tRNA synthetase alpha subunit